MTFHVTGLVELSQRCYRSGEFELSIRASERVLELEPSSAVAYNNIGAAYCALQLWDKTIAACKKALELSPQFELARNNLRWATDAKKRIERIERPAESN